MTRAYDAIEAGITGSVCATEPMSRHTTYRIGGPADLFIVADTVADLALTLRVLAEEGMDYIILGKGSNVLVSDSGYKGAVITLGHDFKRHSLEGGHMRSGSATVLAHLVQEAFSQGLSGLEFAVGIPGTLGGALAMNAGSRSTGIGEICESLTLYVPGEGLVGVRGSEISWEYRRTDLAQRGIIVECMLRVSKGDRDVIRQTMEEGFSRRKQTQPVGIPCAGSVFVNPPDESAGRLIEEAGLKGLRIGGAAISGVHANFIVNDGGATAFDVLELVRVMQVTVKDKYGIELRPEIRLLGAFDET